MQFEIRNICSDAEISARIYLQILQFMNIVQVPPYTEGRFKGQVFKTAQDLMSKLSSVRLHKETFLRCYEERLTYHSSRNPKAGGEAFHVEDERKLVGELEAFLFQVKSSLDIATKFLIPCAGLGEKKAETFSDAGSGIIKQLRREHIQAKSPKERLDMLIACIEWNQKKWIQEVVDARTNTIHREATQGLFFRFSTDKDGKIELLIPTVTWGEREMNYPDYLTAVERLLFNFCRDFVALSLYLRAPGFLVLQELPREEAIKAWNMPTAEHVHWQLALRV